MNPEKDLTLTEDQIEVERGNSQAGSFRSSYLNVNNEGSDGTDGDGTDGDGTDGTDGDSADADGADSSDAQNDADTAPETGVSDADDEDKVL